MSRIAYVDGRFAPLTQPAIWVEDRGLQFADAVYEVWAVRAGRLVDHEAHLARLARSLAALEIAAPMSGRALTVAVRETLRRNRVRDGLAYLQITRGAAPRDHAFPPADTAPTVILTAKAIAPAVIAARAAAGIAVVSRPDERWARCDIKSTALLANVLAKQAARVAGAAEAWLVDRDGYVTEGASSTAWIVDAAGVLTTPPLSEAILPGVTRASLLRVAQRLAIPTAERRFTIGEAQAAPEALISSALNPAIGVVRVDGTVIGGGAPGPITRRLHAAYWS